MPVKFFVQIFQDVIHHFSTPEWSLLQIMHEDLCAKMVMGYSKNRAFLAHLWCAYAMVLCLSWIVRRAVGCVCVDHNYPKMWMD